MKKYVVKTESELKGDVAENKPKKSLRGKIGDIILTVIVVLAFAVSGSLLYIKIRYVACFVSGMSMYPTFNLSGTNSEGELFNPYNSYDSQTDGSMVDFLLADESEGFIDDIERFDIVCSYYPSDYTSDGVLSTYASEKIKRVIGLPGETVWLVTSNEEGSKYCGNLYVSTDPNISKANLELTPNELITQGYKIEKVDQPLTDSSYDESIQYSLGDSTFAYNNGQTISYSYCWTLGGKTDSSDGEYILLGDNRKTNCSRDSRSVGKINGSYMQGKIIAGIGKAEISENGNNASFKLSTFKWRKY